MLGNNDRSIAYATRMHSSRMSTDRCSGRLSCHALPLPAMHAPYHACPLVMHAATCPPACMPPQPPPRMALLWTEFLTHTCENITFPQLLLRTLKMSIKYQGVKEFHMLARVGCCNIMVFSPFKVKVTYYHLLNLWLLGATSGDQGSDVPSMFCQNMPQTSNSLLSPTKSMVARGNQW